MSQALTSIIIVSADSGPTLRDCVQRALASRAPVEVIIADNDSDDGVPEAVERALSGEVRLSVIYHHRNLGFGAAVNAAAEKARGEYLLVLNPDCLIEPDTVEHLRAVLEADPHAGLVGAVICDPDGTPDPASRRHDPLLRRALRTLRGRDGGEADGQGVNVSGALPDGVSREEAVSGALMMLPQRVFRHMQGFDTGYFLHCEDLDLCRRLRDARYRVLLAGQVRVTHVKGTSGRHRPVFVDWHKHRGMWRWFRKFDPAARNPLTRIMVWTGLWSHFLLRAPRRALTARRARTDTRD